MKMKIKLNGGAPASGPGYSKGPGTRGWGTPTLGHETRDWGTPRKDLGIETSE